MKQWHRDGEWQIYSNCHDTRHITPPEKMSTEDVEATVQKCFQCKVRPECLINTLKNGDTGVWCASVWLPEVNLEMTKREAADQLAEAEKIREGLAGTIEDELKRRGDF